MKLRFLTSLAFLQLAALSAGAEGTAQLMPAGSLPSCISYVQGNDGAGKEGPSYGRPDRDLIHVRITNPATEVIYYGFTRKEPSSKPVYYQILDPAGNIIRTGKVAESAADSGHVADNGLAAYVGPVQTGGAGGYQALVCRPTLAGDYLIRFNVGHPTSFKPGESRYFIHPFDVTVASLANPSAPVAIPGRLFCYKWTLNTASSSNRGCMSFYTWTPDSLVVRMDMNGIQPFGYTVSFNSYGSTQTGNIAQDRRSSASVSTVLPEYPVFLSDPDPAVFPTGTPGAISYVNINTCAADTSYCIYVHTTRPGEMNIFLDLDQDGTYSAGTADVYFPYESPEAGNLCIPWDGRDAYGNRLGAGDSGLAMVQFLAGEVHYPVWDPENHPNGFTCAVVRPSGMIPRMYWDNSATAIGTQNVLAGCLSGCNAWTGNKGDRVLVNTWLNTITSADTAPFIISAFCPPVPADDSACTEVGKAAHIPILLNDSDPDGDLDAASVSLFAISDPDAVLLYHPSDGLLSYWPAPGDSATLTLRYSICDQTQAAYGGPFCSSSYVQVDFVEECLDQVFLESRRFPLELRERGGEVLLRWYWAGEAAWWQVERSADGQQFEELARLRAGGSPEGSWADPAPLPAQAYRIAAIAPDGALHHSPPRWLRLAAGAPPRLDLRPQPAGGLAHVRIRCQGPWQLRVYRLSGAELSGQHSAGEGNSEIEIDVSCWPSGMYVLRLFAASAQAERRLWVR
jgi:hypothetical protein